MRKTLAGMVLTGIALAATGVGAATAEAAATPRCHTKDLKIGLKSAPGEAGMMKVGFVLSMTNTSYHRCRVHGYPKLALENSHHRRLHTETTYGSTYFVPDPGPHTVVLRPGHRVVADLAYAHIRQSDTVHATYLRVTPPGETTHVAVPLLDRYVWRGRLQVTAFASHLAF